MKRFTSIPLLAGNPGQAVAGRRVLLPGRLSTGRLCRRAPAGLVRQRESCRAESHDSVTESTRGVPVSVLQPDVMQGRRSTGFVGNRTLCVLQSAWPLLRYDPKGAQWSAVSLKLHQANELDVAALRFLSGTIVNNTYRLALGSQR